MYIKDIILDGWKSYATRVCVNAFDKNFTAITGLNGSGKSNILDAICFVLGISNLSLVRVGNLSELVYKQGQAGINKATVAIVFDNSDRASSPVGYENDKTITISRQIVIGGKNKYMINGRTVQQQQVQNLFHSVQLNVNNPHFLIMQGRITKVLNMKPDEILGMIEEAAGTRMFETKKAAAFKTIEKKQQKVVELTSCLDEEITPTLEKLRSERQGYMQWQANNIELARLDKFVTALQFTEINHQIVNGETMKVEMTQQLEELRNSKKEKIDEAKSCQNQIVELETMKEKLEGGEFQELKAQEKQLKVSIAKESTIVDNKKKAFKEEQKANAGIDDQIKDVESQITVKEKEVEKFQSALVKAGDALQEAENVANRAKESYTNAIAGKADEDNTEVMSLPQQVAEWEKREREAKSVVEQCGVRLKHAQSTLKDLRKALSTEEVSQSKNLSALDKLVKEVKKLESRSEELTAATASEEELKSQVITLQDSVSQIESEAGTLEMQLGTRLDFQYKLPEKGFDKRRVKGPVAKNMRVSDQKYNTALEVIAGGKLFNIVVDTHETGTLVLKKGELRNRTTMLPLDKLNARRMQPQRVQNAQRIAQSMSASASLAIDLVRFDSEVTKAMEFCFGNTIVCDSREAAKRIAFDPSTKCKTVTLEGDVFDPAGTMSGGSSGNIGTTLKRMSRLSYLKGKLETQRGELADAESNLSGLSDNLIELDKITDSLDLKREEASGLQELIGSSSYAMTQESIHKEEVELDIIEKDKTEAQDSYAKAQTELKRLQHTEKNIKKEREDAMKRVEKNMKDTLKTANDKKKLYMKAKGDYDALGMEIDALRKDIEGLVEQRTSAGTSLETMQQEVDTLVEALDATKAKLDAVVAEIFAKEEDLNAAASQIKELDKQCKAANKAAEACGVEHTVVSNKLKELAETGKGIAKQLKDLVKKHGWLEEEKDKFGVEGGDYDFTDCDAATYSAKYKTMKSDQDRMSTKINKKVTGMIEKAETEYNNLTKKRDTIMNDKTKIEDVISELDIKKMQALQSTWIKVNRDFGSIFSMLLPGTAAKLEPPEGMTVQEGLEVKVAFNGTWKQSLTELSGGQRSLLALSLILALLLFKPAPMYILDEVDAALDLSHTQNIGVMLRTHFSHSQFIVVSLKEGMFNNANVIFRTRFVDGVSCVLRTTGKNAGKGANLLKDAAADEEEENQAPQKNKGGKKAGGKGLKTKA
jgi:structural maintenance of chromosome 2